VTPERGSIAPLVVVGELNADIVVALDAPPAFGQAEQIAQATDVVLGSSSAITACGAARMGVPTALVSVRGDDLIGRFLTDQLRTRHVDVSAIRVDAGLPTGISTILTLPGGERSMITAMGAIGAVTVADVPDRLLVPGGHVHVGSYFLQHGLHDDLGPFFSKCRSLGMTTSLDPNDDPRSQWDSGLEAVMQHVDVLFCNVDEALAIADADGLETAESWFARRMHPDAELVVKRGGDGAHATVIGQGGAVAQRDHAEPPSATQPLVDTIGAGDSLAAGYIAARLRGLPVDECLRVGVANGTASTRAAGGTAAQLTWAAVRPAESGPPGGGRRRPG
jgi:sugar/nucleoside kinase (ribokinase family)